MSTVPFSATGLSEDTSIAPYKWSSYMLGLYFSMKPPLFGTTDLSEVEEQARRALKDYPSAFMYAGGSAGTNSTYRANLRAFEKYRIIPRMLVDASVRNLETTIFGVKYPCPIFMAPIGVQGIFSAEGELAAARAAKNLGVPFIMSTASSRSLESVAKENGDGHRWYQLYWPRTNDVALSIINRAKASGFSALVVTLDTMTIGWRPHDLAKSYMPFAHGWGIQIGLSDPVFMARYNLQPVHESPKFPYDHEEQNDLIEAGDEAAKESMRLGVEWLKECNSGLFRSWEDLKFIRDNWEGPLVLKGIQSVSDAEKALEHGVNGIVVSNHGGRQVDGAIPSLYALKNIMASPKIQVAQKSGQLTVLFDSGIRNGPDIIKAMALGAQAVLVGRPWLYGAAVAGQAGVEEVLKIIMGDLDTTLGLSGYQSLADIQGKGDEVVTLVDL